MDSKLDITVLLPTFNSEKTVKKTEEALKCSKIQYEIFIVDDGSKDNTHLIAKKIGKNKRKIKVIRNKKNFGMGKSIKICSIKANYKFILLVPGDDSFTKKAIINLASAVGKADFIIGYRINYTKIVSLFRKITFFSMKVLAFFLTGKFLKEVNGSLVYPTYVIKKYNLKFSTPLVDNKY